MRGRERERVRGRERERERGRERECVGVRVRGTESVFLGEGRIEGVRV